MNKVFVYTLLLAGALLLQPESENIGKLKPVETVSLYIEEEQLVMETDTEDIGRGNSVEEALRNLKETTSGIIYLDTADYLLVSGETEQLIPQIGAYLKDTVRVCRSQRAVKVTEASSYLSVHRPNTKLKEYRPGAKLEELCIENSRMYLKEKM